MPIEDVFKAIAEGEQWFPILTQDFDFLIATLDGLLDNNKLPRVVEVINKIIKRYKLK